MSSLLICLLLTLGCVLTISEGSRESRTIEGNDCDEAAEIASVAVSFEISKPCRPSNFKKSVLIQLYSKVPLAVGYDLSGVTERFSFFNRRKVLSLNASATQKMTTTLRGDVSRTNRNRSTKDLTLRGRPKPTTSRKNLIYLS